MIRKATVCATVVASAQTAYDRVLASRLDTLEPKPVWNFFIRPAPGLNPHTLANVCVIDASDASDALFKLRAGVASDVELVCLSENLGSAVGGRKTDGTDTARFRSEPKCVLFSWSDGYSSGRRASLGVCAGIHPPVDLAVR